MSTRDESLIFFDGSNGEDLLRLVTMSRLAFLREPERYEEDIRAQCGHLAKNFRGPALDWVGNVLSTNAGALDNFQGFYNLVRAHFGIDDGNLDALRRAELDALRWRPDLPVFFAEFDRLTSLLGLAGDAVKIALVRSKLPTHVQKLLAEQALDFAHYPTMRTRLLTMWALDPSRSIPSSASSSAGTTQKKRGKCSRCGKRGHAASDCRSKN
jgi:hypothetical protein